MEKYSYIIVGIIVLIFNIYRKTQKKKKEVEMAMQMQEQQRVQKQQQQQVQPEESFPTDFLEDFDKHFGNTEDDYIPKTVTNEKKYNIPDIDIIDQEENEEDVFEHQIEDYNIDNKNIIKPKNITKNNVKINLKQAIIYNAILERKY